MNVTSSSLEPRSSYLNVRDGLSELEDCKELLERVCPSSGLQGLRVTAGNTTGWLEGAGCELELPPGIMTPR